MAKGKSSARSSTVYGVNLNLVFKDGLDATKHKALFAALEKAAQALSDAYLEGASEVEGQQLGTGKKVKLPGGTGPRNPFVTDDRVDPRRVVWGEDALGGLRYHR